MWSAKTVRVQLDQRVFELSYPYSPSMKNVIREIFEQPEYPICLPKEYTPEIVVDVGANIGAAAIWFHHYYPDARIVCFEPSPVVFDYLQENTRRLANIEAHNIGLFDAEQEMTLHVGEHHAAQSSILPHDETGDQTESIQVRRAASQLEALGIDRISILKLDTEGCEVPILRNLVSWLDRIDCIYVEYHSEADRRAIDQLLANHFELIRARVTRANLGTMVFRSRSMA
jgi:FkbM family methyltransferase